MLGRLFTVGGYTLLSRLTGFARDIMLVAILGAGPVADAFFVALRLPNHFRAIFAAGAFNAVFVQAYAHVHGQSAYKHFPVAEGGLPVSERLATEVISLPMHAYLDEPVQDRIIAAVRRALGG